MINEDEIREQIEDALIVFGGFWEADEEQQMKAVETATRCMRALLQMIE